MLPPPSEGDAVIRLDGKVAIITGGARGQGAATGQLFAESGATVYLTDVDEPEDPASVKAAGITFLHHDVSQEAEWARVIDQVLAEQGRIDVLINNAGIIEWRTMTETPLDVWQRVIGVNQTGPFLGMKAVAAKMISQGSGSVIKLLSVGG